MPVSYPAGTIKEHKAVREAVGLFDVSHMGEVYLRGPRAREVVAQLTTNAVESAPVGKAVYTLLCRPTAASSTTASSTSAPTTTSWSSSTRRTPRRTSTGSASTRRPACDVVDVSDETALIAVQGPKAVAMVDKLAGGALAGDAELHVHGRRRSPASHCIAARTGYTGEDGFELACANARRASQLWAALLDAATPLGGLPIGLGARDTLRLESQAAALRQRSRRRSHAARGRPRLGGQARQGRLHRRDALRAQKAEGLDAPARRLQDRRRRARSRATATRSSIAARPGERAAIGTVTSGGPGIMRRRRDRPRLRSRRARGRRAPSSRSIAAARTRRRRWFPASSTSERSESDEHAFQPISATPTTTSGCARRAPPGASASRSSPSTQLGDITLVDLPKEGDQVTKGQRFGTIESVKSVSDLYAPVSGRVIAVNAALKDAPEAVNSEPYGKGWMIEIEPNDKAEIDELMDATAYTTHVAAQ